jgi:L-asparaginase II
MGNYLAPGHPLQQAIRRDVTRAVGLAPEQLKMGIDGCSAPNYAMPLLHLACGYARLASGAADSAFGASFAPLAEAIANARGTQVGERKAVFRLQGVRP